MEPSIEEEILAVGRVTLTTGGKQQTEKAKRVGNNFILDWSGVSMKVECSGTNIIDRGNHMVAVSRYKIEEMKPTHRITG